MSMVSFFMEHGVYSQPVSAGMTTQYSVILIPLLLVIHDNYNTVVESQINMQL